MESLCSAPTSVKATTKKRIILRLTGPYLAFKTLGMTKIPVLIGLIWLSSALGNQLPSKPSVYEVSPVKDGAIIGGTALIAAVPYLFARDLINKRCPCDRGDVNAFDRISIGQNDGTARTYSDIALGAALLVPVAADLFDLGVSREFAEDAAVYAETLLISGALVGLVKVIVQRPLPVVYAGQDLLDEPEGYRSFYSGHVTMAFTALSAASFTLSRRYRTSAWPWIGTAVVGSSIAVARVLGGRHFISDTIVGAAVGTTIGILVPLLHSREDKTSAFMILPNENGLKAMFVKTF